MDSGISAQLSHALTGPVPAASLLHGRRLGIVVNWGGGGGAGWGSQPPRLSGERDRARRSGAEGVAGPEAVARAAQADAACPRRAARRLRPTQFAGTTRAIESDGEHAGDVGADRPPPVADTRLGGGSALCPASPGTGSPR